MRLSRPDCPKDGVNISSVHNAIGSVSSSDRPTLRKAGGRASVDERLSMESPSNQNRGPGEQVPARQQNRNHARHRHHRRRAPHQSKRKERKKPHRRSHKENHKEHQRREQARLLRRAHPRYQKRRAKVDSRQKAQRHSSPMPLAPSLANLHQFAGACSCSASPPRPSHRIDHQRHGQQQLNAAKDPRAA